MLKSLDIVNKALKDSIVLGNVINFCGAELSRNEAKQIKQDLEKYSNTLELIKELFKLLYVGYEFDDYCQNDYYFIREYGPSSSYSISEDLYENLNKLAELVGDNHD